jgi:hypothetical protein
MDFQILSCEDLSCKRKGLTSSCVIERRHLLIEAMFSTKDKSASDECWSALKCIMYIYKSNDPTCNNVCSDTECVEIIESKCPERMFIPTVPYLFSDIYLVYEKNTSQMFQYGQLRYLYMCSKNSYYDDYFAHDSKISINNLTCHHLNGNPLFVAETHPSNQPSMFNMHQKLWRYYQVFNYTSVFCNRLNMYRCNNSNKCISIHRRNNQVVDCPQGDDEYSTEIDEIPLEIPKIGFSNYWIEYYKRMSRYMRINISFQTICNGYTEMFPVIVNGKNETDETDCEAWECNNIYTRCNDQWNCPNGEDELNCDFSV